MSNSEVGTYVTFTKYLLLQEVKFWRPQKNMNTELFNQLFFFLLVYSCQKTLHFINVDLQSLAHFCKKQKKLLSLQEMTKGTIHLRPRQIFTIFDPSAFQQIAYEGDFWSLCTVTFWPSAHGDTPLPLKHADVWNGWSQTRLNSCQIIVST